MQTLLRISAPHFVAGLVLEQNTWQAVDAAPILWWMVRQRWTWQTIEPYLKRKGWTWEVIS